MATKPHQRVPAKLRAGYIELAAALHEHWQSVASLRDRRALIGDNARSFLGASPKVRRRMAERWYGRDHAHKMALRTTEEWLESLRPMLDSFVAYVIEESEGGDIRAELSDAVTYPYFIWTDCYFEPFPCLAIDDIYERTASGFSTGGTFGILQSTGEPFGDDLQFVIQGIFADFEYGWRQDFACDSWQVMILGEHYIDPNHESMPWNRFGWPRDGRTIFAEVQQMGAEDWVDMSWPTEVAFDDLEANFPGNDVRELLRKTTAPGTKKQQTPRAAKRSYKRKVK